MCNTRPWACLDQFGPPPLVWGYEGVGEEFLAPSTSHGPFRPNSFLLSNLILNVTNLRILEL